MHTRYLANTNTNTSRYLANTNTNTYKTHTRTQFTVNLVSPLKMVNHKNGPSIYVQEPAAVHVSTHTVEHVAVAHVAAASASPTADGFLQQVFWSHTCIYIAVSTCIAYLLIPRCIQSRTISNIPVQRDMFLLACVAHRRSCIHTCTYTLIHVHIHTRQPRLTVMVYAGGHIDVAYMRSSGCFSAQD